MKKKSLRILSSILTVMMILSFIQVFAADGAETTIPDGAAFKQVDNLGVAGSVTYTYIAPELHVPGPMMTPVFYVYADTKFASKEAAWEYITGSGLVDLANKQKGAVMVMNPVGNTWGADDVKVYWELQDYLWFTEEWYGYNPEAFISTAAADMEAIGAKRGLQLTYHQMQYLVAEKSGATFVSNFMTANANRIAGALLVGGTISGATDTSIPLPVYIAGGTEALTNYYKNLNGATVIDPVVDPIVPGTAYTNPDNDLQRVIVEDGATSLNATVLNNAWKAIFQRTVRQALRTRMWDNINRANTNRIGRAVLTTEVFTLMGRPVADEIGLTVFDRGYNIAPLANANGGGWFEWVPNEAIEGNPGYESGKKFPLVISLHGGNDHPIFEAEANGWVKMAGQERFILVGPSRTAAADSGTILGVTSILAEVLKTYPIDESRIYVTGFSAGARATNANTIAQGIKFAAVAPIDPMNGGNKEFTPSTVAPFADEYDIPYLYVQPRTQDTFGNGPLFGEGFTPDHFQSTGDKFLNRGAAQLPGTEPNGLSNLNGAMAVNNMPLVPEQDFEKYPLWGFERPGLITGVTKHGQEYKINFWGKNGAPLVGFATWEGLNHTHFEGHAELIWSFFKNFSRDPDTKEIIYGSAPKEGVTVTADPDGPTGYKATFVYKNAEAQNVRFFGDCMWFAKEDYEPASSLKDGYVGEMFTPYQWEKGMFPMHVQANNINRYNGTKYYTEMTKTGDYWTVTIPLPSGPYKYCYYVDSALTTNAGGVTYINTNTGKKVLDPANMPLQNPISGNYANFSTVYMPFDPVKQDEDLSIQLPIDDPAKKGSVVFERIAGVTTPGSRANVDIGIYLPPNYDNSGATTYKVFYCSHGGGGHERDWTHDGVMPNIMDHMIASGKVDPKTIVVAVNFGATGTGSNDPAVMQLVQRDYVIPLLEGKYHASAKIMDRAYAGLSRGGRISADMMVNAANDSNFAQYGTWGVWAPQDVPTDNTEFPVGTADKPIDVIRTLSAGAIAELNKLNIIIDSGAQDKRHVITSTALIKALEEMNVDVVKGPYPNGGHDWMNWPKSLEFFVGLLWEGKQYAEEGVTVNADPASPTGYTATFVYKNADAARVQINSKVMNFHYPTTDTYSAWDEKFTPHQWKDGMFAMDSDAKYGLYKEDMTKIDGTDYWTLALPLPSGAYSYSYLVTTGGTTKEILDPANLPIIGVGATGTNALYSMVYMPRDPAKQVKSLDRTFEIPREDTAKGKVEHITYTRGSDSAVRPLAVYLPPNYDSNRAEPYKVLYISHGGGGNEMDWMNDAAVPVILDNMIADGKTEGFIVASMAWNQSQQNQRNAELIGDIIPKMESVYNVSKEASGRAMAGLSAGGTTTANVYMYDAQKDSPLFGYFGIWSSGNSQDLHPDNLSTGSMVGAGLAYENMKNLTFAKVMVGCGIEDDTHIGNGRNRQLYGKQYADKLKALGVDAGWYAHNGAHDWMLWPLLFVDFVDDVLWKNTDSAITNVTVGVEQLVAGFAANVPVTVQGEGLGAISIKIVSKDGLSVYGETDMTGAGKAIVYIGAAKNIAAGTYDVIVTAGASSKTAELKVVPFNTDIWAVQIDKSVEGKTRFLFAADISTLKGYKVVVNGTATLTPVQDGNALVIGYAAAAGDTFVISGVKYAKLFPSYSFTFTVK